MHPLIVHLPVVVVPLVAAGLALFVAVPSWRRVLGPLLAGLAVAGAAGALAATWSGEALGEALRRGAELDRHRSLGARVRNDAVLLAIATVGLVAYERHPRQTPSRVLGAGAAVVVIALGTTAAVALTGHSGAQLAWGEKLPPAGVPAPVPTAVSANSPAPPAPAPAAKGQPGVDVVLGEWALVTSVSEVAPGSTTFRFRNLGTVPHAFRIRSAGSGKNRLEWRSGVVAPGASAELTADLPVGSFELDCPIEDGHGEHDALGMEAQLAVRVGAPAPVAAPPAPPAAPTPAGPASVTITGFAFVPPDLRVAAGTEVTWTNRDPALHTATGDGFDTGRLAAGASASHRFTRPGTFTYLCTIHPAMTGRITVDP